MKTIRPPFAKPGDTIGVYSPSSGIESSLMDNYELGKKVLLDRGYHIREAPHARDWESHYSSNGKNKNSDLMGLLRDPDVKAILPALGGTTAYQLLPYLDFGSIQQLPPKMIFGFSDNALQACVISDKTGLITFHGHSDVVFGLGDIADSEKMASFSQGGVYTSTQFFDALEGRIEPGPVSKATEWKTLRAGDAEGRLLGGNLDVLQILHGTDYELDWNEKILFWEAAFVELHRVDLMLAALEMTGVLGKISGMVVGKATNLEEEFFADKHESFEEMIERHCAPYEFPIITNADIGHDMECCTLPNGVNARLEGNSLFILESPYA